MTAAQGNGRLAGGVACPVPAAPGEVQLGHGSGGTMSAALLRDRFLPHLSNPSLEALGDAALVKVGAEDLAVSTDSFVVSPLEFPGGNIGSLAVHGTLNDLAMMGAEPVCLTAGFILEEGLAFDVLDRVVTAMGQAARAAGVPVVTGDTKVVDRGKADGLFINTTGLGRRLLTPGPAPDRAAPGDAIVVSGPIGRHGMAIMAVREGIGFEAPIESDSATLWPLVQRLAAGLGSDLHVLRDPTRGGVASSLNEIAAAARVGMVLADRLPVPDPVASACEILGLDPLYVANEGIFLALVPAARADQTVDILRSHPLGREARIIGRVVTSHPGFVVMETGVGGTRIVSMLPGDQLPRIC
jgi:hydrogenase expression/formation protein HypE